MIRHIVIYKAFDVVIVPFPFTDSKQSKKRPALIISSLNFNNEAEHSIMVMITTAFKEAWPLDMQINDLNAAGLPEASAVRMKLFTLDNRLISKKIGTLGSKDQKALKKNISILLSDIL